ncbi:transposase, partial [Schaalia suimastitidis]|uniref:transposase n=1 Tax=Schaalia suimastitidis TaxID=121163 RepID=UPI0013F46E80
MSKRYSQEFKDRAVRMVGDRVADDPSCTQWRAINEIAPRMGISVGSMRRWYEQSLIDTGQRPGLTRQEREEIKRLKRENAELQRANEILKLASAFSHENSTTPGAHDHVH